MGEKQEFQPLTREDTVTVMLYRAGIVLSAVFISGLAYLMITAPSQAGTVLISPIADILVYGLYASVGMSVFFIHLYVGKFKVYLKYLYFISLGCLVLLLAIGKGSLPSALALASYSPLLLLPLSGCLGFVTAKEAFCFQLFEGYLLAMIMPIYLVLVSGSLLSHGAAVSGLALIAVMLIIFTVRKVSMPIAYDIGDKSAYR
jgi:uncharacterized integral membrane protein